ncbi:MAG: HAMP domain-containing protein [Gammaproteobacteria bacterium]|nr:HAMP domain-containing protein [Gammaproteobacteria bacterium]MCB1817744.1 HAMP domain-containing protein [Gammaproteobacteria bacterium]HPQ25017.1 ATP-binding protein [Gammaproteobacteria bacterium]
MPRVLHTLKAQISLAIGLLTLLFAGSTMYSLHVIDQQHSDDTLVQLAGRLQFNQQQLAVQAMRYQENAPRDYPSYYRDLRLYFEDLKTARAELTHVIDAFARNRVDRSVTGESMAMTPDLPPHSLAIARELAQAWSAFLAQLDERTGPDPTEPRLEWAAKWIVENHAPLGEIAGRLSTTLADDVAARAARANLVNRLLLAAALIVAVGIFAWFYLRVLSPLGVAVEGFRLVANGDFAHKVPVIHNNEIGWLADSFNRLSERMDSLRKLLTRLEQGADLESMLRTLSESLPSFIPVDWIGVLVFGPDGRIHLEKAFSDGKPDNIGELSFEPERTLLEECINSREPLHIPDVRDMAALSDAYVFLRRLAQLGRRDAIFLPIGSAPNLHGVAVFANRYPNSYRSEHLALLRNLGVLLGVSLGRTIQLVENSRLATIGQFASGIAHEIRNPLATISLALEHLRGLDDLPDSAKKRADLGADEVARLERLLADILLYAKPLSLKRSPQDIADLVAETVKAEMQTPESLEITSTPCPPVSVDRDRLRQVLINLLHNAQQASPPGIAVKINCRPIGNEWAEVVIANGGEAIPEKTLQRVFEPFFTSKPGGTGLGLPIVQRIVSAHGGKIELKSDAQTGTMAILRLPLADHAAEEPVQAAETSRD